MAYFNFKEINNSNIVIENHASNNLSDYIIDENISCEDFLKHLIKKGIVQLEEDDLASPHKINTVRELHELCENNASDTRIFSDAKAGELFASRCNADDNRSKFTGYKVLELRYYDCEPEANVINFKYPYTEKKQFDCNFNVRVFINNPMFFNTVLRLLYEYSGPILIYDYWRPVGMELLGTVEGIAQIERI